MSNSEQNQPVEVIVGSLPSPTATVVSNYEGEDGMGSRSMTVGRYEEIRRRLAEGRGMREIARARLFPRHGARGARWRAAISRCAEVILRSAVDAAVGLARHRSRFGTRA